MNTTLLKLTKCVSWLTHHLVSMTLVLLLLPLMDGHILSIPLIIGAANVKINLVPLDQTGSQIKAIILVLSYSMESELLIGQNQDNTLTIITALLIGLYQLDSIKSKKVT